MPNVAVVRGKSQVARPLKVLIPLIQGELQQGNEAARDHYRIAGEMLIEAKDQVTHGGWGRWLTKNFDLSHRQAQEYMRWAREHQIRAGGANMPGSLRELRGATERDREDRQSKQQQAFKRVLRDVARDDFMQERQSRDEEVRLHREMAEQLIKAGYHAMSIKLHPDKGGAPVAMARLNRVRDELRSIAQTRRFV